MKKVVLFAASLAIATIACAQKPAAGDMGVTFGITGISVIGVNTAPSNTGSLVFKYLIADDMTARAGLLFGTTHTESESTTAGEKTTSDEKLTTWGISVGASKHFGGTDRLDPYFGADLMFARGSGNKTVRTDEVVEASAGTVGDYDKEEVTEYGPITTIGLIPVVGFNYFIAEKVALGAEFGWGFMSTSVGEGTTTTTHKTSGTVTTDPVTNTGTSKTSGFGTAGSGSISMSIFF